MSGQYHSGRESLKLFAAGIFIDHKKKTAEAVS